MTFAYNAAEDAIDVGGIGFGNSKKWRDGQRNWVTFLIDESWGKEREAIEIRGHAEALRDRRRVDPRIPELQPGFSGSGRAGSSPWGDRAGHGERFTVNARDV